MLQFLGMKYKFLIRHPLGFSPQYVQRIKADYTHHRLRICFSVPLKSQSTEVQVTADYVDHRLATFPLTFQELAESCDLTKCAQASPQHALYLMGFHGLCTRH